MHFHKAIWQHRQYLLMNIFYAWELNFHHRSVFFCSYSVSAGSHGGQLTASKAVCTFALRQICWAHLGTWLLGLAPNGRSFLFQALTGHLLNCLLDSVDGNDESTLLQFLDLDVPSLKGRMSFYNLIYALHNVTKTSKWYFGITLLRIQGTEEVWTHWKEMECFLAFIVYIFCCSTSHMF